MLFYYLFLVLYAAKVAFFGFKQNPMLHKKSYYSSLSRPEPNFPRIR